MPRRVHVVECFDWRTTGSRTAIEYQAGVTGTQTPAAMALHLGRACVRTTRISCCRCCAR